jgi:hypothetical protein
MAKGHNQAHGLGNEPSFYRVPQNPAGHDPAAATLCSRSFMPLAGTVHFRFLSDIFFS